jgi:ribosomal protein S18 acetylase RimI-like enzyme
VSPAGGLTPARDVPAETVRLLEGLRTDLAAEGAAWAAEFMAEPIDKARRGELLGLVWRGPKDDGIGLAFWTAESEIGRRLSLYLADGYRSVSALDRFLDELDRAAPAGAPVVEVNDQIPGMDPADRRAVFERRGYVRVPRTDRAFPPDRALPARRPDVTTRRLRAADGEALVGLLVRAYSTNPIDRALFRQFRDLREDARSEVKLLLGGELGPWIDAASFTVERPGGLGAATIVNEFHGALITEVVVDPEYRRRGWARALLAETLSALRAAGRSDIRLVVTKSNTSALELYRSVGFEPVEGVEGATWLHRARLQLDGP